MEITDPQIKKALKKVDFKHDGIMARPYPEPIETYLFDLKYKKEDFYKNHVNVDDYEAYFSLRRIIPFLIVVYVIENDSLYFHRVRDPQKAPKPYKYWDNRPAKYGGQKYVYQMPEEEYCLISGFDIPFEPPKSWLDYYAKCRMVNEQFIAWKEEKSFTPRSYEEYIIEIMKELKEGFPRLWANPQLSPQDIPKAITEEIEERKKKEKRKS